MCLAVYVYVCVKEFQMCIICVDVYKCFVCVLCVWCSVL